MDTSNLALKKFEWIAWGRFPMVCTDSARNQTEHVLAYWIVAFQPSEEKSSNKINDEDDSTSFDRLKDLDRSWREAARALALIQENLHVDQCWQKNNASESIDSPPKPS
jgi:hypothetical protein